MPISRKTIEGVIAENSRTIAQLQAENAMYQKLLDADKPSAPVVKEPKGQTIQRYIAAIQAAGRPLHVSELLAAIGRTDDENARMAVNATLRNHAKRNKIFVLVDKRTFGLTALGHGAQSPPRVVTLMGPQ